MRSGPDHRSDCRRRIRQLLQIVELSAQDRHPLRFELRLRRGRATQPDNGMAPTLKFFDHNAADIARGADNENVHGMLLSRTSLQP
jgi:hypothetical protein